MKTLQKIEDLEDFGGDVDMMIDSILRGPNLDQLHNLAYLMDDLMGDVKMTLLIRKRIVDLDESSLRSQHSYGRALVKAGHWREAEACLTNLLPLMRQQRGNSHRHFNCNERSRECPQRPGQPGGS